MEPSSGNDLLIDEVGIAAEAEVKMKASVRKVINDQAVLRVSIMLVDAVLWKGID